MKKWFRFRYTLLLAALTPLSAWAQQTAVPLGSSAAPYGYYEYLPSDYNSDTRPWPVVVFLHGLLQAGNGTTELPRVLELGVPSNIAAGTQYPFIAISPQSPNSWWSVGPLDDLIEFVKVHYRVDRVYLTGISMGGAGVWDYAKAHPEKLAAIVPIAGGSVPDGPALANLPTWAFHAWGDGFVSADASVQFVEAIADARSGASPTDMIANYPGTYDGRPGPGYTSDQDRTASYDLATGSWIWQNGVANPQDRHPALTLYHDYYHDSWTRTYANPTMWEWLLAQGIHDAPCVTTQVIVPTAAGAAQGGLWFPMEDAFDAQPTLSPAGEPTGGSGGSDAPYLPDRVGYIDFGPDWNKVRITATWTRYRTWSVGDQTPYAELWWDDDTDSVNDGTSETRFNFNSAHNLATGLEEPWLRDSDLCSAPVTPQARYLLARAPSNMTNRAKEYAILGHIAP